MHTEFNRYNNISNARMICYYRFSFGIRTFFFFFFSKSTLNMLRINNRNNARYNITHNVRYRFTQTRRVVSSRYRGRRSMRFQCSNYKGKSKIIKYNIVLWSEVAKSHITGVLCALANNSNVRKGLPQT